MSLLLSKKTRPEPIKLRYSTEVSEGVFQVSLSMVNVFLVGLPGTRSGNWFLVDCAFATSARKILNAAEELYGPDSRPRSIILTHGHFDHVGALKQLLREWEVPVYAHPLELPYLDGRSSYPPPDPGVGGGAMSILSPLYPRGPQHVGRSVHLLPQTGEIPGFPEWEWIPTPGHTEGHISLFRESDGTLIAGDAFVTTRQESMICALLQPLEINGPPKYFTSNWAEAWDSVLRLNRLPLEVAATGHGKPIYGSALRNGLSYLATNFFEVAVPEQGRYIDEPAIADDEGVAYVPPREWNRQHLTVGIAVIAVAGALIAYTRKS